MTYEHKETADLKPEAGYLAGWYSGCLAEFCRDLRRANRDFVFSSRDHKSVYVYVEGERYVRGYVTYGSSQRNGYGDDKFGVSARGIINNKYGEYTLEHHIKASINIKTALKTATRNLVAYTTRDIERLHHATNIKNVDSGRQAFMLRHRYVRSQLGMSPYNGNTSKLLLEFGCLIKSGYKFIDPQVQADITELLEMTAARESMADTVPMTFVYIYPTQHETRADILFIADARTTDSKQHEQQTWVADALPESILGKVMVLQMCEDGHYVEGVGSRIGEHIFYVHEESDAT